MKFKPLPIYEKITVENIPECSTLLFYGGTKITEWFGNNIYKHSYKPPAYHAAFYIEDGLFLNVGKFKSVQEIAGEFKSRRRIDVISYKYILKNQIEPLKKTAYLDSSKPKIGLSLPDYDWTAFLRFGFKWFRQSKNKDFCSENVVQIFNSQNIKVSKYVDYDTAPWDLFDYALENNESCKIKTLWTGKEFKGGA